jgi:ATP-dependent Lon protease
VDYDLSNVMFITTANRKDQIPGPLRDRMEILDFTGYIDDEKINIAKNFLVPKQVKENALNQSQIVFLGSGLRELIHSYTREAGVRNLEREIANICRKRAREVVEGKGSETIKVTSSKVGRYLGPETYHSEVAERVHEPGSVVGLAWTAAGGDILFIETSRMPGRGQ